MSPVMVLQSLLESVQKVADVRLREEILDKVRGISRQLDGGSRVSAALAAEMKAHPLRPDPADCLSRGPQSMVYDPPV